MAAGNVSFTSLDQLLDIQPPLLELTNHANTAEWFRLGTQLELDNVKLNGCNGDLARVYDLWIMEKAQYATRRNLLDALRAIGQNDVAYRYEEYLKTLVSGGAKPTDPIQPPYPPGNPPSSNYVPQSNPVFPHHSINPTVGGGGYPPNPYPQHYPPQPYQNPYPAPNPPYYHQPYGYPYAPQFNPYAYQPNPNPPYAPQTNPNPAYAPQTNPSPAYAPQTNPNPAYAPQTNPNPAFVPQPNPHVPAPYPNVPAPYPNTTNFPVPAPYSSTTNVPAPQPNPSATPLSNVNTIVTDKTRADFNTQVNMQHDDKRVGLVVIMGVVNKHGPQGTDRDIKRVQETFEDLNFATWVIKDPTPDVTREAVKIVTEYDFPISFRGVVVYYAGHGGSYNDKGYFFLPCGDDKHEKFLVDSELIAPFQPKNGKCRLANRFRLFLFDCCLKEDSGEAPTAETVITTNPLLPTYQPGDDYTVVAHASYLRKPSKGDFSEGGVWTVCLCNNIEKYASGKTISGILEQTRLDVISKTSGNVQAPFHKSIGGDVKLIEATVPSPPVPPPSPPSDDDIDIEKIMNAIPDKSDLMTVLDGIKGDVKKWRDLFGKRLLKDERKGDSWFRNFSELEFLINEITGENADDYIYTWGSVINALDKPTTIEIGSKRAGFKPVSDVVRDYLNNRDVYDKYIDTLK